MGMIRTASGQWDADRSNGPRLHFPDLDAGEPIATYTVKTARATKTEQPAKTEILPGFFGPTCLEKGRAWSRAIAARCLTSGLI